MHKSVDVVLAEILSFSLTHVFQIKSRPMLYGISDGPAVDGNLIASRLILIFNLETRPPEIEMSPPPSITYPYPIYPLPFFKRESFFN